MSDLKYGKHLKSVKMTQKGTSRTTFGCCFHHFDQFSTFQIGHPENPKIHNFAMCSIFPIGHPEIPKIHQLDNFSHFRISRSLTGRDNTNLVVMYLHIAIHLSLSLPLPSRRRRYFFSQEFECDTCNFP